MERHAPDGAGRADDSDAEIRVDHRRQCTDDRGSGLRGVRVTSGSRTRVGHGSALLGARETKGLEGVRDRDGGSERPCAASVSQENTEPADPKARRFSGRNL